MHLDHPVLDGATQHCVLHYHNHHPCSHYLSNSQVSFFVAMNLFSILWITLATSCVVLFVFGSFVLYPILSSDGTESHALNMVRYGALSIFYATCMLPGLSSIPVLCNDISDNGEHAVTSITGTSITRPFTWYLSDIHDVIEDLLHATSQEAKVYRSLTSIVALANSTMAIHQSEGVSVAGQPTSDLAVTWLNNTFLGSQDALSALSSLSRHVRQHLLCTFFMELNFVVSIFFRHLLLGHIPGFPTLSSVNMNRFVRLTRELLSSAATTVHSDELSMRNALFAVDASLARIRMLLRDHNACPPTHGSPQSFNQSAHLSRDVCRLMFEMAGHASILPDATAALDRFSAIFQGVPSEIKAPAENAPIVLETLKGGLDKLQISLISYDKRLQDISGTCACAILG
ncbi:hypothetical protein FKP32DRAFT_1679358 [Trametes sanguinea]|nr:hypothetical protein FKP32DRAFT_1679358 [Trametes sanguinea]